MIGTSAHILVAASCCTSLLLADGRTGQGTHIGDLNQGGSEEAEILNGLEKRLPIHSVRHIPVTTVLRASARPAIDRREKGCGLGSLCIAVHI